MSDETFDDPWYEGKGLVTLTFEEADGRTTLTGTTRYDTKAIRDSVLKTPMEGGVARSYERLDEVLQSMAAAPPTV